MWQDRKPFTFTLLLRTTSNCHPLCLAICNLYVMIVCATYLILIGTRLKTFWNEGIFGRGSQMLLFPRPGDNVVSARARSSQETLMSCFIDHSAGHKKPRLFMNYVPQDSRLVQTKPVHHFFWKGFPWILILYFECLKFEDYIINIGWYDQKVTTIMMKRQ